MTEIAEDILKAAEDTLDAMLCECSESCGGTEGLRKDAIGKIGAAILAERQRTDWQPIETAPKNRKVIAAYRNGLGNWRIVTACYHTELPWSDEQDHEDDTEFAPEGWYEESDSSETIYPTSNHPTHWMPLPSAPTLTDEATKARRSSALDELGEIDGGLLP